MRADAGLRARLIALLAGLLLLAGSPTAAGAAPRPIPASVVSVRDSLLLLASADSVSLPEGMTLVLRRGKRTVATARVVRALDARFAQARLVSGSLARERKLSRLTLLGEDPPITRTPRLHVGLPGPGRTNLLFACGAPSITPRLGPTSYAPDTLDPGGRRWLRSGARPPDPESGASVWSAPDTLVVQFFADPTDQEIALERGELDVAVFWPGELSPRMRADPRWREEPRGVRSRGVVACIGAGADTMAPPAGDMAALDREAFGGDLLAWRELEPDPASGDSAAAPAARYIVDPALPGARLIERVLARGVRLGATRSLRLTYLDVPVASRDAAQASWRTRGVTPVFAVRCPVLARPEAREVVRALGANAFAELAGCP